QTRTFTAVDACGNTATTSRTVTWTADLIPPSITATGTTTSLGCNPIASNITAALGTATATDACGSPTVSFTDGPVTGTCTQTQTRTFTAVDACGNTATTSRTVTWTADLIPPSITATGTTLTLACNPAAALIDAALGTATATDACGSPTVSFTDGPVTGTCTQTQTRTITAGHACGHTATTSRTVTWTADLIPPSITATGTTLTLACNPAAALIDAALGTATATDACGSPTVSFTDGPVTGTCTQTQTRTFTAVDACGNTATTSRTVTWTADLIPPSITATGTTLTLACNPAAALIDAA